jgi:hypothetical protein
MYRSRQSLNLSNSHTNQHLARKESTPVIEQISGKTQSAARSRQNIDGLGVSCHRFTPVYSRLRSEGSHQYVVVRVIEVGLSTGYWGGLTNFHKLHCDCTNSK